ncbi:MAG TPA: VOC family protein [Opitutaceae bacterium]|nr:VOC family protein [Opitutaceae bacterium]
MSTAVATALTLNAYLNFDGRCEEALNFYQKELGAKVTMLMRFKDSPEPADPSCGPIQPDKVMHCSFTIGESVIMASDCNAQGKVKFEGFSLAVAAPDEATVRKMFNALANGGQVCMPLDKTFFSPLFGVVSDKFGVSWMIMVQPQQQNG